MEIFITAAAIAAVLLAWKARGAAREAHQRLGAIETTLARVEGDLRELYARGPGAWTGEAEGAGGSIAPGIAQGLPAPDPVADPGPDDAPRAEPLPAEPRSPAAVPAVQEAPDASPTTAPAARPESLEEALGTRWAVWVGGLAVALGALLMVRHSIEQGWFGPLARLAMSGALGLALMAGGEWLRRREPLAIEAIPAAHIPSMLTATGTIALFGTVYAAHGIYGFIGPTLAFLLLGAVAIATMLLAALHGPALAGIGLAGAMIAPMLVRSPTPNPWPLVVYLLVVAAAAYGLARLRRWLWLAVLTVVGAAIWGLLLADAQSVSGGAWAHAAFVHLLLQMGIAAVLIAVEPHVGKPDEGAEFDLVATLALSALTLAAIAALASGGAGSTAYLLFTLGAVGLLSATGFLAAPSAGAIALAGMLAIAALVIWPPNKDEIAPAVIPLGDLRLALSSPSGPGAFVWLAFLAPMTAATVALYRLIPGVQLPLAQAALYAGTAAVAPLIALIVAYLRLGKLEASATFAMTAALLSLAFTLAMEHFRAREQSAPTIANRVATGALATAAIAALALAFVFYLERGYLTVALALTALGTAFVADRRALPVLRFVVTALGLIVLGRLAWDPLIMGAGVGATPILNWLLVGYGVPALSFWSAGYILRAGGEDLALRICQGLAVLFTALLVFMQMRHLLYAGDVLHPKTSHIEQGLVALVGLGFSAALTRLDIGRANPVYYWGGIVFAVLTALNSAVMLGFVHNPLLSGERVLGPAVASSIALAYGAPALAALALKEVSIGRRPDWLVRGASVLALMLVFAYVTLEVRHIYQGERIGILRSTSDAEQWAYSAAWLVLGMAFLAWGVVRGSREARLASVLVVVAAVLKVFLVDLAGLRGIWRPLSLIGLGLVLLAIAMVYQRLIFARPAAPLAAESRRPEGEPS